jgi:hypothetical protein
MYEVQLTPTRALHEEFFPDYPVELQPEQKSIPQADFQKLKISADQQVPMMSIADVSRLNIPKGRDLEVNVEGILVWRGTKLGERSSTRRILGTMYLLIQWFIVQI